MTRAGSHLAPRLLAAVCCLQLMAAGCTDKANDATPFGAGGNGAGSSGGGGGSHALAADGGELVECQDVAAGPRRLWRLTPTQYDNTVRDLLGVDGTWGEGFPADSVVNGFANNAAALLVTPLWADKAAAAAEDIAAKADVSKLAPCSSGKSDQCLQDFVTSFGQKAFRRPVTDVQSARYAKLGAMAADFASSVRLVITAMLQSPHFLYRRELGVAMTSDKSDKYALDDYEIASELSYMTWQSMPDETLLSAASKQSLHTPAQIKTQLTRLLGSDKARPMVRNFVIEWLGLAAISTVPKDMGRFPDLSDAVRASMLKEVEHFVDYVMFDHSGSLADLLTEPTTFLDDTLAKYYGVTLDGSAAEADGLHATKLADQERAGILTLGGVMLRHARSNDASPVLRGRLIRERFLCQVPPPPPPGIVVQPPPLDPKKPTRERYAAHSVMQPCAGCHRLLDPIGFSFDHFDGDGRYRKDENGAAIDVSGEIIASLSTDGKFDGVAALSQKLGASDEVQGCFSRQWLRFAYGLDEDARGLCVQGRVQASITSGAALQDMIASAVSDDQFRIRVSQKNTGGAGTPGSDAGGVPTTTSDAGSQPAADSGSLPGTDAGTTMMPPGDQLAEVINNNDYGTGYCKTYQVTNQGDQPLTWSVSVDLGGMLSQNWESTVSGSTGKVTFTGVDYNATLMPKSSSQFGFCVTR